MPKAVIFDVDGTLIDSVDQHARAWQEAFRHFGHTFDLASIRDQIGKGGDQLMPVFLSPEDLANQAEATNQYRSKTFKDKFLPHLVAFPCVRELFKRLQADNKTIAIASSAKGDELDTYLRIADINDLVAAATSSEDAERSKPHPDIFQAVLRRLPGINPRDMIAVGDSPYDATAAGKAGIRTIGLLSGGFAERDLREAGCIAVYRNIEDLLKHFNASPLAE